MPHITNCPVCGKAYEEVSEEEANNPYRLCERCGKWGEELCNTLPAPDPLDASISALIAERDGLKEENERLREECTRYVRQLKYYQDAVCFDPPKKWWAVDGADSVPAIEPERLEVILESNERLRKVAEAAEYVSLPCQDESVLPLSHMEWCKTYTECEERMEYDEAACDCGMADLRTAIKEWRKG